MDTHGNGTLREMLAAEYALGTLRGGARRRFERWLRTDAELRALAYTWSERLVPLVDDVPSAVPPPRVWAAIAARLPGAAAVPVAPASWWDRVGLWRGLSAAFAAVAVFAIAVAMRPTPVAPPRIVQAAPDAVSTLLDPKTGKAVAVVVASAHGDAVTIRVASDVQVPPGKVLQLWISPRGSETMESMGVLPAGVLDAARPVPTVDAAVLARAQAFGLSLEPAGGSAKPSNVLGLGAIVRLTG